MRVICRQSLYWNILWFASVSMTLVSSHMWWWHREDGKHTHTQSLKYLLILTDSFTGMLLLLLLLLQVSVESLKASNGILAGDYISAGDTITVPYWWWWVFSIACRTWTGSLTTVVVDWIFFFFFLGSYTVLLLLLWSQARSHQSSLCDPISNSSSPNRGMWWIGMRRFREFSFKCNFLWPSLVKNLDLSQEWVVCRRGVWEM